MRLPSALAHAAIFPLWPIVDGRCSCSDPHCNRLGKHPACKWSELEPGEQRNIPDGYGVGLATGARSGVWVLDIDCKNGVDGYASFERLCAERDLDSDIRCMVRTPSGGLHLYFALGHELVKSGVESFGPRYPGLDIRGEGGYVVIPPSMGLVRPGELGPYAYVD